MPPYKIDTTRTQDDANRLFELAARLLELPAQAGQAPEFPDHRTRGDDVIVKIKAFEDARAAYHQRVGRTVEWASGRMCEIALGAATADQFTLIAPPATRPPTTTTTTTTTTTATAPAAPATATTR